MKGNLYLVKEECTFNFDINIIFQGIEIYDQKHEENDYLA